MALSETTSFLTGYKTDFFKDFGMFKTLTGNKPFGVNLL